MYAYMDALWLVVNEKNTERKKKMANQFAWNGEICVISNVTEILIAYTFKVGYK